MRYDDLDADALNVVQEALGYLNFSEGSSDPQFLRAVNTIFALVERHDGETPAWIVVGRLLRDGLDRLHGSRDIFRQVDQAEAVLRLVFDEVLPAYRRHHGDLLFHQTDAQLFQPLFVGRVCEAVLKESGPWEETDRIVRGSLARLNDYLGHRPVAVLETERKIQPYKHEWVRPIPLYIRGVGVAVGRYEPLIAMAIEILEATDPQLLFQACFDPTQLDELAIDPRAYDFDHPVNKRPNYLFGQWDLGHLDNSGLCRRFVLQEVALDAMVQRIESHGKLPYEEVLFEAAAVLAGTILMGSGVSGDRPDAHDSSVTLATLVQHIAAYRDVFYESLIGRLSGPHAERLRTEAEKLRQPFGGARQDFNQCLARRRAEQLQHVHLAVLFARMGYTEAAARQVRVVPVISARMQCDIHCRLNTAHQGIEDGQLDRAAELIPEIEDLMHRAIGCGALVDPWNILGFGAQYSLFPALENSVHDHRVDELIDVVGELFDLYVRLEKEAAATGSGELQEAMADGLDRLAVWWDQFASVEVGSVEGISGQETAESARHVAVTLRAWHEAGTAAGDIAFWQRHVESFRSPKAYALVVEALLEQGDHVAAMALLVQWLAEADEIPLADENYALDSLALHWMEQLWSSDQPEESPSPRKKRAQDRPPPEDRWPLARKFLDYLEANAETYWEVPRFELGSDLPQSDSSDRTAADSNNADADEEEGDWDALFDAAYEGVTYHGSTDDGFEGEVFDAGSGETEFELIAEAERILERLGFLTMLAGLWKLAAVASMPDGDTDPERDDTLAGWLAQATEYRRGLARLMAAVDHYRIAPPRGTHEALVEYDHRRAIKEMLLEQIIAASVETADAARMIFAAMRVGKAADVPSGGDGQEEGEQAWEAPAGLALHALLRGDADGVQKVFDELLDGLMQQPILYVALARGGNPQRVVASRNIQRAVRRLLNYLPRLGLLFETSRLIETVQDMELEHPVGPGSVTEFDRMFDIGCRAIIRCLVVSSEEWKEVDSAGDRFIDYLEHTTEALLRCWLAHSQGVRLSVMEAVVERRRWADIKKFIERYGNDLFTQRFMNMGNLRGILHQGVETYLHSLEEEPDAEEDFRLIAELGGEISLEEASLWLGMVLEAVVENYSEYIDYNTTTTQSDRGEMLYTLLDFLRLRATYDRVAWNLQPVMLAHEVLMQSGRIDVAETWRNAVAQKTEKTAADHLRRYTRLVRKYGMRLASIADRLGERFVQPLAVDQLRALVHPAIDERRMGREPVSFKRLEQEIAPFTEQPTGTGFEVPKWLDALEQEIDRSETEDADEGDSLAPYLHIPEVRLTPKQARRQLEAMAGDD